VLWVHLTELEKSIHIIRVSNDIIFFLNGGILLAGYELDCVILFFNIEFLFKRKILCYSW